MTTPPFAAAGLAALAFACAAGCASPPPPLPGGLMVTSSAGRIQARDWGKPDGPPLLLIHGSTSHLMEFEASLAPTLKDEFRLVAYDRPGMGRSTQRPANAGDLDVQVQAAVDVIAALKLDRPVVVAHSYGGAVALRLALDHPDKVAGLVLLAPASHPWDGGAPFLFQVEATPVVGELVSWAIWPVSEGAARNSLASRVFAPLAVPEGYFEVSETHLAMRPAAMRASAKDFVALVDELREQAPRYGELKLPISVLAGEEDAIAPIAKKADPANPAFSNMRLVILPGVGHMPQHAHPETVEQEIRWVIAKAGQ